MATGTRYSNQNYDAGQWQNIDIIWYELILATATLPKYSRDPKYGDRWVLNPAQNVHVTYRVSSTGLYTLDFNTPATGYVKIKF